jgi:hypothetical protein
MSASRRPSYRQSRSERWQPAPSGAGIGRSFADKVPRGPAGEAELLEGSAEPDLANQDGHGPQQQEGTGGQGSGHIHLRSGFGGFRNEKPAVRSQRGPRVTQQILFFNYYSLHMTLYHDLGDYLAISPARYGMVRPGQHLGWTTKGYSSLHSIIPPNGQIFSRIAWFRVTTLELLVCLCRVIQPLK